MRQQPNQTVAVPQQNHHQQVQDYRQPGRLPLARPRKIVLQLNQKMRNIIRIEPAVRSLPMFRFRQLAMFEAEAEAARRRKVQDRATEFG